MLKRIIEWSVANRLLVLLFTVAAVVGGIWAALIECAASDGGVDPFERSRRRDKPVAAEGERGAAVDQGTEGVRPFRPLRSDDPVGPPAVIDGVIWLHAGDHA